MRTNWKVIFLTGILVLCSLFFLSNSSCDTPWRKEVQEADLYDVDLFITVDGVYTGQHEYRDYMYRVQAEVIDHQIMEIGSGQPDADAMLRHISAFSIPIPKLINLILNKSMLKNGYQNIRQMSI